MVLDTLYLKHVLDTVLRYSLDCWILVSISLNVQLGIDEVREENKPEAEPWGMPTFRGWAIETNQQRRERIISQ